ncbi:MAG: GtrA family protein, partial [Candidatus Woesearchaeota archaeon]
LIMFFIVGFFVSVFNLIVLYFLVSIFNLDKKILAPAIALELSILLSFFLNNKFTFKNAKKQNILLRLGKFHLAAMSGFILNLTIYNLILRYLHFNLFFGHYDYLFAQAITIFIVFFWNYFVNSRWTWKK